MTEDRGQRSEVGGQRVKTAVWGSFDLDYEFKGFDHFFHAVWRHASNQLRLVCFWIVEPFRIQGTDFETEKYRIFGKAGLA